MLINLTFLISLIFTIITYGTNEIAFIAMCLSGATCLFKWFVGVQ